MSAAGSADTSNGKHVKNTKNKSIEGASKWRTILLTDKSAASGRSRKITLRLRREIFWWKKKKKKNSNISLFTRHQVAASSSRKMETPADWLLTFFSFFFGRRSRRRLSRRRIALRRPLERRARPITLLSPECHRSAQSICTLIEFLQFFSGILIAKFNRNFKKKMFKNLKKIYLLFL